MLKKLLSFLSLPALLLSIFVSTPVAALEVGDVVMSISPSEQVIELTPGEQYTGSVKVMNVGRLDFNFTLEAAPYHVNDDDYDPDFSTDSSYTNLKNWLKLPKTEYHLEPGEEINAEFLVDVPTDAPNGGQYAAIMIRNYRQSETDDSNAPLNLRVQAAAVLYGHVQGGELRESAELVAQSLPSFILGENFSAISSIKNSGNVDFYARQTISIRNFFTNNEITPPVDEDSESSFTDTTIVLPGTTRTSILNWNLADTDTFPIGLYRVSQTIVFLDQTYSTEHLLFICPVWLAIAILFLIFLAVIWLILTLIKRRKTKRQNATF